MSEIYEKVYNPVAMRIPHIFVYIGIFAERSGVGAMFSSACFCGIFGKPDTSEVLPKIFSHCVDATGDCSCCGVGAKYFGSGYAFKNAALASAG